MSHTSIVAITGASGLLGTALQTALQSNGHTTRPMVRREADVTRGEIHWDPATGQVDTSTLQEADVLVHLAGESIASGRWTVAKKKRIRDSRIQGTELLARSLAQMDNPPQLLISASAIGFYGHRGDEVMTEKSTAGPGFLADVCRDWEAACQSAVDKGIRVVHLRIGVILSATGGALSKMLLPFRLCLGGPIGRGTQYMSWISLTDMVNVILHAMNTPSLTGAVNAVAPHSVTNAEFTSTLAATLRRPAMFPMPEFAAKLVLGEMAQELLLSSTRVVPDVLQRSGFSFQHSHLKDALQDALHPSAGGGA